MRIAVCQLASSLDVEVNRHRVLDAVDEAADGDPDVVVLPEAMMHDFGRADLPLTAVAEPLDGPFVQALQVAAARSGAVVVAGMFERRASDSLPYNTVVAVAPDGAMVARYRKLHLYDAFAYTESDRLSAGWEDPPVFEVAGMHLGLMTCYDLRFPEVARLLVDAGADVLVVPAAWTVGDRKVQQWQHLLAARAIENTSYVVAAAQPGPRYAGNSAVLDPAGDVSTMAGQGPELLWADLDPAAVTRVRAVNPSFAHRRFTVVRR